MIRIASIGPSIVVTLGVLALAGCGPQQGAQTEAQGGPCDRACLTGLLDRYLAALDAGDPGFVPVTDTVRFTEDQEELAFGAGGIWASDVSLTDYRYDVIDVREQIAVAMTRVEENGADVLMTVRLLTDGGRIHGVETMVVRDAEEGMLFNLDGVQTVREEMIATPPPGSLNTREEMIDIAERYPEGLRVGSFVTSDVPMAPDVYRLENGMYMGGPGCSFIPGCDNMKEQTLPVLSQIVHHISAVDEEAGIVMVRMDFGPGSIFPRPGRPDDGSLSVFEAFKIYDGQMQAVEAFMKIKPAAEPLLWD